MNKTMKEIATGILIGVSVFGVAGIVETQVNSHEVEIENVCLNTQESTYEEYLINYLSWEYGYDVIIVNSNELSLVEIESRSNEVLVEKCIGKVVDSEGNGKVLNCYDEENNYIYYGGYNKGTYIITYLVYNPNNKVNDDIIERYDLEVSREF